MKRIIYQSPPTATGRAAGWVIIQDPLGNGSDQLVCFRRHNGKRCLLDQIAEWQPKHPWWTPRRWVPNERTVPLSILDIVYAHMKEHCGS